MLLIFWTPLPQAGLSVTWGLSGGRAFSRHLMARTVSTWTEQSRRVIAETLAKLPKDAPLKFKRKALREAYPFGLRQYHPYRMWCLEVSRAIGPKSLDRHRDRKNVIDVWIEVAVNLWISVDCIACVLQLGAKYNLKGGCLLCMTWHEELTACVSNPDWTPLRLGAVGDSGNTLILADWCEDHGWYRISEALRQSVVKAIPVASATSRRLVVAGE